MADQAEATDWLVTEVTEVEGRPEQVRAELLGYLRGRQLEPPTSGRIDRIVRSALERGEAKLMGRVCALLSEEVRARLNELVFGVPDEPHVAGDVAIHFDLVTQLTLGASSDRIKAVDESLGAH